MSKRRSIEKMLYSLLVLEHVEFRDLQGPMSRRPYKSRSVVPNPGLPSQGVVD